MSSWNKHKCILQLFVIGSKFLKTFGRMLLWINCIFNDITDSSPFYFFLIILIGNWLVCMWKREINKVGLILFELFKYLRVIDGLYFDSLPFFIFLIGSVLRKRDDFFEDLFGDWISMSELIVDNRIVVTTIGSGILTAKHVHLELKIWKWF